MKRIVSRKMAVGQKLLEDVATCEVEGLMVAHISVVVLNVRNLSVNRDRE